ncbi:putative transcription factor interactor and regulator CCHC(Zn) family [Helianthus annuus]|nr:putative transcription factor interactor and regulator CCHC(Zn) family [Helianthus annuus]
MIRSTINTSSAPPQAFNVTTVVTSPASTPTLASNQQQIANLQLMASQLGIQPQPPVPQPQCHPQTNWAGSAQPAPQANFASRSAPSRPTRGFGRNYRGSSRGSCGREGSMNQGSRQFAWASTQNTVYGHCNRCGIGHIPSQCPNHTGPSRSSP